MWDRLDERKTHHGVVAELDDGRGHVHGGGREDDVLAGLGDLGAVDRHLRVGEGDGRAEQVLEDHVEALARVGHQQLHGGRERGAGAVPLGRHL